jgi:ferredoxin-NADP reductase
MEQVNRRVKRGWMNLKVTRIIDETHDTKTFVLADADEGGRPWDYWAGQYLTFRFDDVSDKPLVRSYTMSSSPRQQDLCAITVKRVERGLISNWLCDRVQEGSVLRARGPIGRFIYDPRVDQPHLVMIAAGSGVTPFVSIMREYADRLGQEGCPQKMTLLVSYRSRDDLIANHDLELFKTRENCHVFITLSRDADAPAAYWQGRISADTISKAVCDDFSNCTLMSCGPQAIMDLTREVALNRGVPQSQIKDESFES